MELELGKLSANQSDGTGLGQLEGTVVVCSGDDDGGDGDNGDADAGYGCRFQYQPAN